MLRSAHHQCLTVYQVSVPRECCSSKWTSSTARSRRLAHGSATPAKSGNHLGCATRRFILGAPIRRFAVPHAEGASGSTSATPEEPKADADTTVLLLACGIGVLTGAGVVLFNNAIHWIRELAYPEVPFQSVSWGMWARQLSLETGLIVVALPPTLGGLTLGILRYLSAGFGDNPVDTRPIQQEKVSPQSITKPQSESASGSSGEEPAHWRQSLRAFYAPFLRGGAAAITLGSGCSLGPEGPSVEIGRSAARGLGKLLKARQQKLLPLLAAGSGAGVAAGFNAPIAGVFFAVETVLQSQPPRADGEDRASSALTVAMVLLSCVTAATVSRAGLGETPAFRVPDYQYQSILELPLIMLLGSTCGLTSIIFSYCLEASGKVFKWINPEGPSRPLIWTMLPVVGGVTSGLVALAFPEVLYQGYGNVNALLELQTEDYAPPVLLQMLAAKVFATAVCRGSGLVGGIYAPSIFMGAALGAAYGGIAEAVLEPTGVAVTAPAAYALVGVAGVLAANCNVPLTAVLLLFELTQDYNIIIPTLAAVGISYWTASLPIGAQLAARLRETTGQYVGAGAVTSVDAPAEEEESSQTEEEQEVAEPGAVAIDVPKNGARPELPPLPLAADLQSSFGSSGESMSGGDSSAGAATSEAAPTSSLAELTAQCAAEATCVLVSRETPLAEALQMLEREQQTVALVLDGESAVTGLLTRDRILEVLQGEPTNDSGLISSAESLTVGAATTAAGKD